MDNYGARITPGQPAAPEELTEEERQRTKREGLSAFISLSRTWGKGAELVVARQQCRQAMHAAHRVLRAYVDNLMLRLMDEGLVDDDELEVISEYLYRKLSDSDSASDTVLHVHDEIVAEINLNEILERYKGKP